MDLKVVLFKMPQSNNKLNWQAYFKRKNDPTFKGLIGSGGGICIAWGEEWNRVAYEAERARYLLGERTTEPPILEYGTDIKSPEEWTGTDPEAFTW